MTVDPWLRDRSCSLCGNDDHHKHAFCEVCVSCAACCSNPESHIHGEGMPRNSVRAWAAQVLGESHDNS